MFRRLGPVALFLALFLSVANSSKAIDKGYLSKVPADRREKVFASFAQVPVYYLVTKEEGGTLVQQPDKPLPSFKAQLSYIVVLYLDPKVAEAHRLIAQGKDQTEYTIRSSTLQTVLEAQYTAIGRPVPEDAGNPDFVVFQDLAGTPLHPEYLAPEGNPKRPYVHESDGRKFIPAFLFREEILAFQEKAAKKSGAKWMRVGQDFTSFLDFVAQHADSPTPVVVFGRQKEETG